MKGKVGGYLVEQDFHGNFWVNVTFFLFYFILFFNSISINTYTNKNKKNEIIIISIGNSMISSDIWHKYHE